MNQNFFSRRFDNATIFCSFSYFHPRNDLKIRHIMQTMPMFIFPGQHAVWVSTHQPRVITTYSILAGWKVFFYFDRKVDPEFQDSIYFSQLIELFRTTLPYNLPFKPLQIWLFHFHAKNCYFSLPKSVSTLFLRQCDLFGRTGNHRPRRFLRLR